MGTDVNNTPLTARFLCRIVDNTDLELVVLVSGIHTGNHLNIALLSRIDTCRNLDIRFFGNVNTCNDLQIRRFRSIHTSSDLHLGRLCIVHARRNLESFKRVYRQVYNTDLSARRLVFSKVHCHTNLRTRK